MIWASFVLLFATLVFCQAGPWMKIKEAEHVQNLSIDLPLTATFLNEVKEAWTKFKQDFSKVYDSENEESQRFLIFADSLVRVKKHNALKTNTFKMGINQFSDWTVGEIKGLLGYKGRKNNAMKRGSTYLSPEVAIELPSEVDWRKKGAVTPVKDQGRCGSCWAFSTTGSLEGQHFLKGTLVSLSEQQLVDCSLQNNGCHGGLMARAYDYIKKNGGIDTEKSYPYISGKTGKVELCHFDNTTIGAYITGYVQVPSNETMLQEVVATRGPVSVAIDVTNSFVKYKSGIFVDSTCSSESLNHAVLVVGYGEEDGTPYWLVKNSWNTTWGEQGYIKMRRNYNNMCGIATYASYPLI